MPKEFTTGPCPPREGHLKCRASATTSPAVVPIRFALVKKVACVAP